MSARDFSVWHLPSTSALLAELEALTWSGGGVVIMTDAMPPGLAERLDLLLRNDAELSLLRGALGSTPLSALCEQCGCEMNLRSFVSCSGRVFLVDLVGAEDRELADWATFLSRFSEERAAANEGAAVLVLCPEGFADTGMPVVQMDGRLRHSDAMIWAEFKGSERRLELMQVLSVSVAIELCGWRLDLIEDLVTQRFEDILAPMSWLKRNGDLRSRLAPAFGGEAFACPINLLSQGDVLTIERRLWKAQVASIFPWIEQNRQRYVEHYRKHLRVDEQSVNLGVREVEDLEFGALKHQLRQIAPRPQYDILVAFANMRNALAHRKLVSPSDMIHVLENGSDCLPN